MRSRVFPRPRLSEGRYVPIKPRNAACREVSRSRRCSITARYDQVPRIVDEIALSSHGRSISQFSATPTLCSSQVSLAYCCSLLLTGNHTVIIHTRVQYEYSYRHELCDRGAVPISICSPLYSRSSHSVIHPLRQPSQAADSRGNDAIQALSVLVRPQQRARASGCVTRVVINGFIIASIYRQ